MDSHGPGTKWARSDLRIRRTGTRIFSTAHFYAQKQLSIQENTHHFGPCFTPHGHGHNYRVEISVQGAVDQLSGLLVEPERFDRWLNFAVESLDHKHVNFDVLEFRLDTGKSPNLVPTTENLCLYLVDRVNAEIAREGTRTELVALRLFELDDLWAEWTSPALTTPTPNAQMNGTASGFGLTNVISELTHEMRFRATHRLRPKLPPADSSPVIVDQSSTLHGQEYLVSITLNQNLPIQSTAGPNASENLFSEEKSIETVSEEKSIQTVSEEKIAEILRAEIYDNYDGADLDTQFSVVTLEMIALKIFDQLEIFFGQTLAQVSVGCGAGEAAACSRP